MNIFFTFTFLYTKNYILLENIFGKILVYIVTFYISFFHVASCWKCSNKTYRRALVLQKPYFVGCYPVSSVASSYINSI